MLGVGVCIVRRRAARQQQFVIAVQGRVGVTPTNGTIVFTARGNLALTSTGGVTIVSITRSDDALFNGVQLRRHSVVISCISGITGSVIIDNANDIVSLGDHGGAAFPGVNFYTGVDASAPRVITTISALPKNLQKIRQSAIYPNILSIRGVAPLPPGLIFLQLHGENISFTTTRELPASITYLRLVGVKCTIAGPLPAGIQTLFIAGNSINWRVTGDFPGALTYVDISSHSVDIQNIIIEQLTYLRFVADNVTINSAAPLNPAVNHIWLSGNSINWTGDVFGRVVGTPKPNLLSLQLINYRNPSDNLPYSSLLSMLNAIINNYNAVPSTIVIRELPPSSVTAIVAAAPNQFGSEPEQCKFWINTIKSTKGVTTFTLNATNI